MIKILYYLYEFGFFRLLFKQEVYPDKNLYQWPDGIWSQKHINLEKIARKRFVKKNQNSKKIKKIVVLGNLSKYQKNFYLEDLS